MVRLAIFLGSFTIFLLLSQSLFAQSYPSLLTYNETNTNRSSASAPVHRVRSENDNYLEAFFLPDKIPTSGIPVLENALGDIVKDSMVNILDLLRLRDIIIGRPPAPSSYENSKGDLNRDGKIDAQDLNFIRDILLHKTSVPYLVDSTGGQVLGDGITLTLPPGAVDSTIIISIRRNSESEFAQDMGVDTKGAIQDSAYFMASFEITSTTPDFELPVNATIKLDSIPPCAYQGLNGLFAAVPDRDGDGRTELFLINELQVNGDSLKLTTKDIQVPSIQSLSHSQIEPGKTLFILGKGFGNDIQNIIAEFRSMSTDSAQFIPPSFVDDSTIVITTPGLPNGQYQLSVHNVLTGVVSNAHLVEILPHSPPAGDIRSIIINFYTNLAASLDSVNTDSLFTAMEDSIVRNYFLSQASMSRTWIDYVIAFYISLDDSLIDKFAPLASFIQNITGTTAHGGSFVSLRREIALNDCLVCEPIIEKAHLFMLAVNTAVEQYNQFAADCIVNKSVNCDDCINAESWRQTALRNTDVYAALRNLYHDCLCRNCGGMDCDKCPETVFIGYGPQSQRVTGGYGPEGFGTKGCCINIIRYKRNQCISSPVSAWTESPVPQEQRPELKCPSTELLRQVTSTASINARPHPGSIIKITNAPVPYNIVGILNDNGNAFIPQVPMNTKIIFSMYDPVTGLYDPNVGTYTTGSTPGGFDRPILLFQPTTEIRRIAMRIGETKHDSVSLDWQRINYLLNVTAIDTGKMINFGFEANALLFVRLEDPQGNVLLDNNNTDCYYYPRVRLNQVGTYTLRVSYSVSGQAGSFTVGVDYYPKSPIGTWFLCGGFIVDTLYEELSPYLIEDPLAIIPGDTVIVEHGVYLLFEHGGSVTSNGTLMGNGSSAKPIKLKHVGTAKRELATIKEPVSGRKEVEP
jgi:hypothetical protein